jgi:hypothetical protein
MNLKIKQLAIESKLIAPEYNGFDHTRLSISQQKFAELIVQECIDIIAPYSVRMSKPGEEYLHPIQEIKKHFGVEQ